MTIKKFELYLSPWASFDELSGSMDAIIGLPANHFFSKCNCHGHLLLV
jgi:hypothetical protein